MSRREERTEIELLRDLVRLAEIEIDLLGRIYLELSDEALTATITIGGNMPLDAGGTTTATLTFVDANNNPVQPPTGDASGLTVVFDTSDQTIATVGPSTAGTDSAGNGNYTATVTGVAAGTYTLSCAVGNASGAPLVDNDGVTAFVQPQAVTGTVGAAPEAQAVTGVITIA